jgi:hypothetical protein
MAYHVRWCSANGFNVFFGVALRATPESGRKSNLLSATALWADIDEKKLERFGSPLEALEAFPSPPSIVVASGSGANLHAYWLLGEPAGLGSAEAIADFEGHLKGLARALDADVASTDASRVLRLPGTLNHKHAPPVLVAVTSWHTERRYTLKDFPQARLTGGTHNLEIPEAVAPRPEIWIPSWVQHILDHGYSDCRNRDLSANDFKVAMALLEKGFRPEEVLWICTHAPAIGQRKPDWARYWRLTVTNAWKILNEGKQH